MDRRKGERRIQRRQSELEHWDALVHLCGGSITGLLVMLARLRAALRRRR